MSGHARTWVSVSDMMTGLMMVFLFISLIFMQQVDSEKAAVKDIAVTYQHYQEELHRSLAEAFKNDLLSWNAELLNDTTIRFKEPDVLFDQGSKLIKPRFQEILNDFFPRYVEVIASDKFRDNIEEVRIEGHTSTIWEGSSNLEERYLNNALLSQQRSFAILDYCFRIPTVMPYQEWLTRVVRANGLAFANPVLVDGHEDTSQSRRVEFRVKTKADEKIREIVETMHPEGIPR
jgi:chemotaxis protein MotB